METKQKRKRSIWPAAQMDLLFEVWEDKIRDLRGSRKNNHVIEEMRVLFAEHNFTVTTDEIKVRIHNLTARYKKEKCTVGPSGGSPSTWPYYNQVHRILGSFRIHNVADLVEESISDDDGMREEWLDGTLSSPNHATNDEEPEEEHLNGSEIPPSTPSTLSSRGSAVKRKRGVNVQQEMLDEFKRNNEFLETELVQLLETDAKLINLEEERNQILREMTETTKEFNEALMTFLTK